MLKTAVRTIVHVRPGIFVIRDKAVSNKDKHVFEYNLHAFQPGEWDEKNQTVTLKMPKAECKVLFFGSAPWKFRSFDTFPIAPGRTPTRPFPEQWHFVASAPEAAMDLDLITVLLPYRTGESAKLPEVKKLPDGTCRLGGYKGILEEMIVPEEVDGCPVTELGNRDDPFANAEGYKILKRVQLPATLRIIGRNAFAGTLIEELRIPEGVEKIGKRCVAHCENLKTVSLPQSVNELGPELFDGCANLEIVNIPTGIRRITKAMFDSEYLGEDCPNLKHVYIDGRDTVLEKGVFSAATRRKTMNEPVQLTIHAPAGSYAETYAKEHNIPFVAE
jgi:hypothetical protein